MTKSRHAAAALSVSASLGLAACGGDEQQTTATTASASEARAEASATRDALRKALTQLKGGDRKAAASTVAEGYLQHFEDVEGPLDRIDHELNEKLEDTLKSELRTKISSGAPVAEVQGVIERTDADLATAERKLK